MPIVLKLVLARWLAARTFGGVLALLAALAVPLAALLKLIGLPFLLVLLVVGAPIALVLLLVGLPMLLVLGTVGAIVTLVSVVLAVSFAVLKAALPFVVLFLVGRWVWRRLRRPRHPTVYDGPPPPAAATAGADI